MAGHLVPFLEARCFRPSGAPGLSHRPWGGGAAPRGSPSSGTNCQAGTPDEGAARAVQASGRRGGNAPNPQLPRAFESFVALPSGMREGETLCESRLGVLLSIGFLNFFPLLHLTTRGSEERLEPVCPALAGGLPAAAPPGGASEMSRRRHFPPPAFGLPGVRKDEAFSSERWLVDTGTWSSVLSEGLCTGIKGSSLDATWLLGSRVGWSVCEPQCPLAP